ncbi:MAG: tRNA guanosine(34) transglycosylase Tgt [Alphaproteobacteria bacterium]
MTTGVRFAVEARDGAARMGRLATAHGEVRTPAFMPVGSAGTVKGLSWEAVRATGSEIVLANTYHLMLRPGAERIARLGGLHAFAGWPGPILTDSGGFQVMSLAKLRQIEERGVTFQSHIDGASHELTPERCMEIQELLGSDVVMVLDECTPFPVAEDEAGRSMRLSLRWAERSRAAFRERPGHGLFGIVQGSFYPDLRAESVAGLTRIGFDGYALGGLALGEGQEAMFAVVDGAVPRLPPERPRYLMGVGRPEDIVGAVARGIDLFDCVLPTRSGRTGQAFVPGGTINLRNARHAEDPRPLDEACHCPACRDHSRAYLHHLTKSKEILGAVLLTRHNLTYYQALMADLRAAIGGGELAAFRRAFEQRRAEGDLPPL